MCGTRVRFACGVSEGHGVRDLLQRGCCNKDGTERGRAMCGRGFAVERGEEPATVPACRESEGRG